MECICGCGTRVQSRGLVEANLQATAIALELLGWDKARSEGKISAQEVGTVESLIHRGSLQYGRLLDAIHGDRESAPLGEGKAWLGESEDLRRDREHMSEKSWLRKGTRLRLTEEDIERLDRKAPERSFSGAAEEPTAKAGGADVAGQLERLGRLHSEGVLSDEEFVAAKQRVVGGDDLG